MPWKEVSAVSLRLEFVTLASAEGANVRELCRRFLISPKTGYKWLARHRGAGPAALADRPRTPLASPAKTDPGVESAVLDLRLRHPAWGGRKLRRRLLDLGHTGVPAASTITAILRRHGRLGPRAGAPRDWTRFERAAPNELWQMDFKGHFALAGPGRCHPLTVLDDHSRFALALAACGDERDGTVRAHLVALFRRYGLPDRILCDNGPPWGAAGAGGGHAALSVWLLRLGMGVSHGRPYHPQTQGKDERFHRTLNAEVIRGAAFRDLAACASRFGRWRQVYNHERPHESLGLAVPASRYRASVRAFPEVLPALEYGPGDQVRKVGSDGTISFRGRLWKVGEAFRGQPVGVRPCAEDGLWSIYFGTHPVASLDCRVQNQGSE
jgi:transposase InsO family protein